MAKIEREMKNALETRYVWFSSQPLNAVDVMAVLELNISFRIST